MENITIQEKADELLIDKYGIFLNKDAILTREILSITAKAAFKSGMIEGGKFCTQQLKELQELKYYAGETGYITDTEWKNFIDNIK
jgi:hypothetical protein